MRSPGAVLVIALAGGCGGAAHPAGPVIEVVDQAPPEPRPEAAESRAGHVRVRGVWQRIGDRWVWRQGRWMRERPGLWWRDAHWAWREGRWHWVEGSWARSLR
jgi:hypothetical protein